MTTPVSSLAKITALVHDFRKLLQLPTLRVDLMHDRTAANDPFYSRLVLDFFRHCHSRHAKFPLLQKFRHGVATCVLPASFDLYLGSVKGSARRNLKKAQRNGSVFGKIQYNDYLADVGEILRSADYRQGKMPEKLLRELPRPTSHPESRSPFHGYPYFGVLRDGKLVAYAGCLVAGEICLIDHIFGHARFQSDGIVPMLILSTAGYVMEHHPAVKYYAYGSFFGSSETMRRFKTKLAFLPHRVTWTLGAKDGLPHE